MELAVKIVTGHAFAIYVAFSMEKQGCIFCPLIYSPFFMGSLLPNY